MKNTVYILVFLLSMIGLQSHSYGQAIRPREEVPKTTRILFLLDASGSMMAQWEGRYRMDIAKELLTKLVDSLRDVPRVQVGLRVYGHQYDKKLKNCTDSKLEIGFSPTNHSQLITRLNSIQPKGHTPIAYSLEQAINDFPDDKNSRNVIIMITDGLESCGGDPCAISLGLQRKGIFLKPFVIGLGIEKDYTKNFECMGRFFNAHSVGDFHNYLKEVMKQTLDKTTVTVELLDENGKAIETDVNFAFINSVTEKAEINIVHFRDANGKTDPIDIDAIPTYDLEVYTVPMVVKERVEIIGGRHNVIKVKAPRGSLLINQKGYMDYSKELKAIVRQKGKGETLVHQQVSEPHDYLVGSYDVEVLTLPRTYFNGVTIKRGETTTLQVESPGLLTIQNKVEGFGSIYLIEKDGKQTWVCNLAEKHIAEQNFALQPGNYRFSFRPKNVVSSAYSKTHDFTIYSGKNTGINVYQLK